MKKILLSLSIILGVMISYKAEAVDYYTARLRMERELNYICTKSIGASYNSETYFECRDYYDKRFYEYGLDWDYLTATQITEFLARTNPYIRMCRNKGLISTLLWGCIRDHENNYYQSWKHRHPHFMPKRDYRPHFEIKHHRPELKHKPMQKHHKPIVKKDKPTFKSKPAMKNNPPKKEETHKHKKKNR